MASLEEARRKIEERRAQQKQGGGEELWMRKDDLVIAHALFTGQDDDPYFDTYVAHEQPATGQGQYPKLIYCPVESQHDENYDCQYCKEGLKTKDRMIMWFWVYDVLHSILKQDENFPKIMWNNKTYYRREINGPKLWDQSAWRESPLDDIMMLGAQLGNIQATRVNLLCTGEGLTRRYKFYMEPGSEGLDEATRDQGTAMIRPVVYVLAERLTGVATQANPNTAEAEEGDAEEVPAYQPSKPAAAIPAYQPATKPAAPAAKAAPKADTKKPTPIGKKEKLF